MKILDSPLRCALVAAVFAIASVPNIFAQQVRDEPRDAANQRMASLSSNPIEPGRVASSEPLVIVPVPSSDLVHITTDGVADGTLRITDVRGTLVHESGVDATPTVTIDVSDYANGVYVVELTQKESARFGRMVVRD